MRAWIARMTEDNIDQSAIEKAGEILKNGGLAAFPTETVYGLGGNALDAKASEKIYAAKGRPSDNPLIVHIGRMEDLETVAANVPESARKLAAACWPGPLTMIFEKTNAVPLETTGGLTSVAVRYPSNKVANALILAGVGSIAATWSFVNVVSAEDVLATGKSRLNKAWPIIGPPEIIFSGSCLNPPAASNSLL